MKKIKILLLAALVLLSMNARASFLDDAAGFVGKIFSPAPQHVTALSNESFDGTTFPPAGWTTIIWNFSNNWTRGTTGANPYTLPHSGAGMARISTGTIQNAISDHTWLISPSFDLSSGQGIVSFWMYRSVDSPGAADSLGVWINTVADTSGANFRPLGQVRRAAPVNGWYQYTFLIPASYNTSVNYVMFCAWGYGGANISIDDISYGVPSNMTYVSGTVTGNTSPVNPNTTNNQVIGIPVITTGTLNPFTVNKFKLRTTGTTNPSNDIRNARIYCTGKYSTFTTSSQYAVQFGDAVVNPNGNFEINGTQLLADTNYFWLTYDITAGAIQGNTVSAVCDSVIGSGLGSVSPVPAGSFGRLIYTPIPAGNYIIGPGQTSPNYPTFTAAFSDLSLRGISGPVVFNVKPAVYGTDAGVEADSSITLNTVNGTSNVNTILFKKKSDEPGEVFVERRGTTTAVDNIITLNGVSYVTFDSINVRQKDTASYNMVEAGYSLKNSSATVGCNYNTIRNARIFLKASNINGTGIKDSVAVAVTQLSGVNSYNKYQNNIIVNAYSGIKLYGYSGSTTPYYTNGRYNEITGNTISGFGGTSTAANGIYTNFEMFLKVANNSVVSGPGSTNAVYGIQIAGSNFGNVDVFSNTVTLSSGTSTAVISGIYVQGTPGNSASIRSHCNIQNNVLSGFNTPATNSGAFYGIYASGSNSSDTMNVTGNAIKNMTIGTTNATCAMYYVSGSNVNLNIQNDSVYNVTKSGASTNFYFIYSGTSFGINGTARISNNYIASNTVSAGTTIYGIYDGGSANADYYYINNNNITDISAVNSAVTYGVYANTGLNRYIYSNRLNRLVNTNTATTVRVYGLYLNAGQYLYAYNNSISNLRTTAGTDSNSVAGIYVFGPAGPTNVGLYYNSVYLADTSSVATYGNSGIYVADTNRVDIRNNNVYNWSKSGGTGRNSAVGLRLSGSTVLRNSPFTNGNNNWFMGAGASALIYYDGANSFTGAQFPAFLAFMNPREQGSVNDNTAFLDAYNGNLRVNPGMPTQLFKGALPVYSPVSITTDYDGLTRNAVTPCIGFSEVASNTTANDVVAPVIIYTPFGNGSIVNKTFTGIAVTDPSKVDTSANRPRLYFKKYSQANTYNDNTSATDGWKYVVANGTSGSPFSFTTNYLLLYGGGVTVGDTIQYFITAQDLVATPNVGINSGAFATTPSSVNLVAANFPVTGTVNKYFITGSYSNTVNVGASESITSLTRPGGLFDLINKGVLTGNIKAVITSDLSESGQIGIKQWSEQTGPGASSLKIVPDGTTERLISGWNTYTYNTVAPADSMGLIRFVGASNVTIDGGAGKYLRIRNKARGSAINFMAGAMFDTVKNCNIESLGDQVSIRLQFSPVIFTQGTLTQGNYFNVLANNVIRERTDTTDASGNRIPLYEAIWSEGRGLYSQNAYNQIYGNEIANFTQGGIFLSSANTGNGNGWTVRKNSFYFSLPVAFTSQFMPFSATLGIFGGLTIDSNYFGGTAAFCGGSPMYSQNTSNIYIMSISAGYDSVTSINANVIQNIRSVPGAGTTIKFNGIATSQGWMDIKGNIFGSNDTSKTIVYNGNFQGINTSNSNSGVIRPLKISGNTFVNIFTRRDSIVDPLGGNISRNMISTSGNAPTEISNNLFSHIYSWQTPTSSSLYFNKMTAITATSNQKVVILNNTISDMGNFQTMPYLYGVKNYMYGIENVGGLGDSSLIAQNRISGIYFNNTQGGNDLAVGIFNTNGYSTGNNVYVVNNQITMTDNSSAYARVYGIYDPGTNFYSGTSYYYYNTVLIGGSNLTDQPSYCLFKVAGTSFQYAVLKNNIFYNGRTGPYSVNPALGVSFYGLEKRQGNQTGSNKLSGSVNGETPRMGGNSTFASDNNLLVSPSASTLCDWYGTFYSADKWKSVIGYDLNSVSDTAANIPYTTMFRNTSAGNLNIDTTKYGATYVYRNGAGMPFVNSDFNGNARNTSGQTCLGSHEFGLNGSLTSSLISPSNNSTGNQTPVFMVWSKALFANGYRVQIATDSLLNTIVATGSASDTTYSFTGANALTYYWWRVNPVYTNGTNGGFSNVYNFKVIGGPTQVTLNTPSNNAVNQSLNPVFNWFKSSDLTVKTVSKNIKTVKNGQTTDNVTTIGNYWFELSTDSTFATVITRDSSLTDTTKSVSGLTGNVVHYWRVKSRNQFGWGAFSSVWKFTTLLPAPAAPSLVSPANNAVNIVLNPVLTWSPVQYAATYRMQISTDSTFTTTTWDTSGVAGTQVTVPAGKLVYLTKYYWRVNATNASGTGAYSAFWNFRTIDNTIPLSMSNFVSVSTPMYMTSGTSTRLPVAIRATVQGLIPFRTYRYYNLAAVNTDLGTTSIGAGTIMFVNPVTQNYTFSSLGSLTTSGQYETFTTDASGSYTGWFAFLNTGNARFTQGNYVIPSITVGDTTGVTLGRYALNDSILVLGFSASAGSTNGTGIYGLSVGIPKNFVSLYDNVSGTGKPLSQTYIEDEGATATSLVQFYTDSVNARNGRWGSIIPNTLSNGVRRVEERSLSGGTILAFNTSATGIWPSGVNTVNPAGGTTALRLAPGDAPLCNAPVLVTPSNGTLDLGLTPVMTWNSVLTASNYRIQVATDSLFTSPLLDSNGITSTSIIIPSGKLTTNIAYFWRVTGSTVIGQGSWSSAWYFTTAPNAPNAPVLLSPANNATGQPVDMAFVWRKAIETLDLSFMNKAKLNTTNSVKDKNSKTPFVDGPLTLSKYWLEYTTDSTFTTISGRDTTITDTTKTITGLSYYTKYWWRVKAKNQTGWGSFSQTWNFMTVMPVPSAPVLQTPANGSVGISLTPACTWNSVSFASSYRFQVSADTSFASPLWDTSGVTGTTVTIPSGKLAELTRYYWRVNATNGSGTGQWSTKFNFTTLTTALGLNLKVYLEGFWTGSAHISDTVSVYLANPNSPHAFVDTTKVVLSSQGTAALMFHRAATGNYYIVVQHRNHLQTWSALAQAFTAGSYISYDFTTAVTQAYGNNMKQAGSVWVLYGGDPNMDGSIDAVDIGEFINQFGLQGYLSCDFNGDGDVNALDVQILINNFGLTSAVPSVPPPGPDNSWRKNINTNDVQKLIKNGIKNKKHTNNN